MQNEGWPKGDVLINRNDAQVDMIYLPEHIKRRVRSCHCCCRHSLFCRRNRHSPCG